MYDEFIRINKNFQTSVNLELDLNSEQKIHEYIPTSDVCDVLRHYLNSILASGGDRATTLVGPYGKGKSFLLLVLSYIISQDSSENTYKQLLEKIQKIDKNLGDSIKSFNSSDKKLLPIIINSNYDNLNQAFMLALNEALKRENIENIIPQTSYSVCLDLIKEWNSDAEHFSKVMTECEKRLHISLRKIEMGLKNYSPEAYNNFVRLYNCVTYGMPFNPLVNNDIVHIYSEVNHEIAKHGYKGMFIIFDEFSKFLESAGEHLSKDLKIIQDFAEVCTRSSFDEQMHICCVTHKSLSLYNSSDRLDSFKTVEGRFKEIKFNRSLDENYQIISAAIQNEKAQGLAKKFASENTEFLDEVKKFEPFNRSIDTDELFYGCFPLNPITVYSLIQLSELVAQNERTLFTFISDTDDNSFNSFIHKNNNGLFNVDKIYDYFSPLLKRESGNDIRNIWYRAEGSLSRIDDPNARRIIKALGVILMINDPDSFPADEATLSLCTMLPLGTVTGIINNLIDEHFVRRNLINNMISFASSNNKEIEEQISIIANTNAKSIAFDSVLDELNETRYILPRKYNEENKIIRFYRVVFITEEQFNTLSSFEIFKERGFSDGLVLNLIRTSMSSNEIKVRFDYFNDNTVILRYPNKPVEQLLFDELTRYVSLQEISLRGGNEQLIEDEINLLIQESNEDIKSLLSRYFERDFSFLSVFKNRKDDFKTLLSKQMNQIYSKKIIFNNELINKNNVSVVYQKSANNIMEDLINKRETVYSETSPETTIKHTVIDKIKNQTDVVEVIDEIKAMILHAENEKVKVSDIVARYSAAPYGVRTGIITVLIVYAISELSDNVLLYLKNKEIDLTAGNLVKAVKSDGDYYFRASKGTNRQQEYLLNMLHAFKKSATGNFRIDTRNLCEEYRKFFVGLPMILRNADSEHNLGINDRILKYKKNFMSFSINPYEVVFEKPLELLGNDDYSSFEKLMSEFVANWQQYLSDYKEEIGQAIKKHFEITSATSLRMGLNSILKEKLSDNRPVLNDVDSKLLEVIEMLSYDDNEAVNMLSFNITGSYVEDWMNDRSNQMLDRLDDFISHISESKKVNTATSTIDRLFDSIEYIDQSPMGKLFQNSIESVMDEFGDSVPTEEKIAILTSMLKKYL